MKLYFIVLLIVQTSTEYYFIKVPFSYCSLCKPITCDEQFDKITTSKFIEDVGYFVFYKSKVVGGHHCINIFGTFYLGYEEKTDWLLR